MNILHISAFRAGIDMVEVSLVREFHSASNDSSMLECRGKLKKIWQKNVFLVTFFLSDCVGHTVTKKKNVGFTPHIQWELH